MEGRGRGEGQDHEPRHPIGVVTQRTGLTTHALRAWERRYGAVEPGRSEGGHRLYSDADVERLRLLHELTLHGHQIGQIADLPDPRLRELLREDRRDEVTIPAAEGRAAAARERRFAGTVLEDAYDAVERLDSERLDALLRRGALLLNTSAFLGEVLIPLMTRIGEAWDNGELRPSHEHLASAVASRVTGWMMDVFEPPARAPVVVVGTPAGCRHELGALAAAVVAASEGWRVEYLGPDLPAEDLALAVRRSGARALALSLVYPAGEAGVAEELARLRGELPAGLPVVVGGAASESYASTLREIGAVRLDGYGSLQAVLERLAEEDVAAEA